MEVATVDHIQGAGDLDPARWITAMISALDATQRGIGPLMPGYAHNIRFTTNTKTTDHI